MSDIATELRIIARDGGRLSQNDRALIAQAASDLESALHRALACDVALIEANARIVALQDQAREAAALKQEQTSWHMSTGWIRCENTQ